MAYNLFGQLLFVDGFPKQGVIHREDGQLAEGKLARGLGFQEAAAEELPAVGVGEGDVAIAHDHPGSLPPGPQGREVDHRQLRSHG